MAFIPQEASRRRRVLIAGGGTGGVTLASWLRRLDPDVPITLVEPSTQHHYQSGWVLVAGGFIPPEQTSRSEQSVLPPDVEWIHSRIARFEPAANRVELITGERLHYDVLIVALGLELGWTSIPGLVQALGREGVVSIYSRRFAQDTRRMLERFAGGTAIFTEPETPIKCGGAPQKILHLAHDRFAQRSGVGVSTRYLFCSAKPSLFPVPAYAEQMGRIAREHGAELHLNHRLVAVHGSSREAVFAVTAADGSQQLQTLHYNLLHVVPPMTAPPVVATSPLASAEPGGWMDVDPASGRHRHFANVFAIGDVGNFPTAKTAAAIRKQAPVVAAHVLAALEGREASAVYDGYSACPLITTDHTVMLMEFDYSRQPVSSFLVNPLRERWFQWLLERFGFPWIYWNRMLKGLPHEGGYLRPFTPLARAFGVLRWQRRFNRANPARAERARSQPCSAGRSHNPDAQRRGVSLPAAPSSPAPGPGQAAGPGAAGSPTAAPHPANTTTAIDTADDGSGHRPPRSPGRHRASVPAAD